MRVRGGVKVDEVHLGTDEVAERGTTVTIRYTGYLNKGDPFQSAQLVTFQLGRRSVIAGLEYGVEGMRVGGKRRIHVPPHLGYREIEVPGIPANAKLVFDVEMLSVEAAGAA